MKTKLNILCVACFLPTTLVAQNLCEDLQRAVLEGDAVTIIKLADTATEADEHYVSSQLAKAVVLYEEKRYDEAIEVYSKLIDFAPEDAEQAYMGRSMARRKKGDEEGANADVEKAKNLREKNNDLSHHERTQNQKTKQEGVDTLLAQAIDKLNAKEYEGAIRDLNTYLKSVAYCDNSQVYASKAYAQEMLGNIEGAIASCTDWLVALPDSADAYQFRARLRRAVDDEQGSAHDLMAYQSVVRETKRKELVSLSEAIAKNPNLSFGYYERAKLYMELGEFEKAEADLDRVEGLDPGAKQLKRFRKKLEKKKQEVSFAGGVKSTHSKTEESSASD